MKKIIVFLTLTAFIMLCGASAEAKTPVKKSSKTRTSQSSYSSQWNDDIPSAEFLANTFFFSYDHPGNADLLKEKGYDVTEEYGSIEKATKGNVCMMEVEHYAKAIQLTIIVYDSTQRDWLYNNILSFIKAKGRRAGFSVEKYKNEIIFSLQ